MACTPRDHIQVPEATGTCKILVHAQHARTPDALETLIDKIDDPGIGARKIERWRQAGWIPDPDEQQRLGRHGTRSIYPSWTADQARAVKALVKRGQSPSVVTFTLYGGDRFVSNKALTNAYRVTFGRYAELFERALAKAKGDTLRAAEDRAHSDRLPDGLSAWSRNHNGDYLGADVKAGDRRHTVITNVNHIAMTGEASYEQAMQETMDFMGASEFIKRLFETDAEIDQVFEFIYRNLIGLPALREFVESEPARGEVVKTVTRDELDLWRDGARFLARASASVLNVTFSDKDIAEGALIGAALFRKLIQRPAEDANITFSDKDIAECTLIVAALLRKLK